AGLLLVLFVIGSVLLLLVDAAAAANTSLGGAFGSPLGDVLRTRRGVLWIVRAGLALALAAFLFVGLAKGKRPVPPALWWGAAALVAAMLLTTSMTSHSAAESRAALGTALDWVHLSAVSIWIGGLVFLALAFLPSLGPVS